MRARAPRVCLLARFLACVCARVHVRARVGQLALPELGSLLASNGAAGCPALLSELLRRGGGFVAAAARQWTALRNLLSQSLPVFPDHREMYAPQPGDGAGRLPSDHHSVSGFYSIYLTGTKGPVGPAGPPP